MRYRKRSNSYLLFVMTRLIYRYPALLIVIGAIGLLTIMINSERDLYIFILGCLITIPLLYHCWNKNRWKKISALNHGLNISRETAYIDTNGYLRWKENQRLIHRDIAWEHGIRGNGAFGECDVHHHDGNKWNNQPTNLQVLSREQHQIQHDQVIYRENQKYLKLAHQSKIVKKTEKAIRIAREWIPISQIIIENEIIYIPEWLYRKKGF